MDERGASHLARKKTYALDGLLRLAKAVPNLDQRTLDIVAYHLHLERELDRALANALPRPDRLNKLSFGQKVSVLEATSSSAWIDRVGKALIAFNNLRNSVAHVSTSKAEIDGNFNALCDAVAVMTEVELDRKTATVGGLAAGICGAMGVDVEARLHSLRIGDAEAPDG
jgi:hypothetical protein